MFGSAIRSWITCPSRCALIAAASVGGTSHVQSLPSFVLYLTMRTESTAGGSRAQALRSALTATGPSTAYPMIAAVIGFPQQVQYGKRAPVAASYRPRHGPCP